MTRVLFLLTASLFSLIPVKAQDKTFPVLEVSTGLSFTRPLRLPSNISYQSGNGLDLGRKFFFLQNKKGSGFISFRSTYQSLHVEGFFMGSNNQDSFSVTPANVKINYFIQVPISLDLGYQKNFKKGIWGIGLKGIYLGSAERRFKIDITEDKEKYEFQQKVHVGIVGMFGLNLPGTKSSRIDFLTSYNITSMADNLNFHPLTLSLNFTKGLGNRIAKKVL
jgi:hypothetical protein